MQCEFEVRVIEALRGNRLTDQVRSHIAACPACQDTERLVLGFGELAKETAALMPPIPDPAYFWQEAQPSPVAAGSSSLLYIISAAVMIMTLISGYFLYGSFFRHPGTLAPSLTHLPLAGSPFPLDGGLVLLLAAVALVIFLPQIGPSKSRPRSGTMMSF